MTKTVSLSDDAYHRLKNLKGPGESFSEVVLRVTGEGQRRSPLQALGTWAGDPEEARGIFDAVLEERARARLRDVEL